MKIIRNIAAIKVLSIMLLFTSACSISDTQTLNTTGQTKLSPTLTPVTELSQNEITVTEIRFEFNPFTDSLSHFIGLRSDGSARSVRFDKSQLIVKTVSEGKLAEENVKSLLEKTQDSAFQESLRRRDFSGEGLSEGDQFYLLIESKDRTVKDVFGFVADTNAMTQSVIADLLAIEQKLTKAAVADAYITGETVAKERFNRLRKEEKKRFLTVGEFPSNLQPIVSAIINKPHEFQALNKQQGEQFLAVSARAQEFFVVANDSGYQLTLFKSAK